MMLHHCKVYEDESALLFQPDFTDPYQYSLTFRRKKFAEPEKRLMLAILEDALRCLERDIDAQKRLGRELCREAEEWLLADSEGWIFSFGNVCEVLGLNPAYIRQGVLCWKERELALESMKRVAGRSPASGRLKAPPANPKGVSLR